MQLAPTTHMYLLHLYIVGIQTEMHETATQLSRLEDILKSSPDKYSLRKEGLRLAPVPALHVVQNPSLDRGTQTVREEEEEGEEEEGGEREGKGGYQPGPVEKGSLKRDGNVVPLRYQRTRSHSEGWKNKHSQDFRYIQEIEPLTSIPYTWQLEERAWNY